MEKATVRRRSQRFRRTGLSEIGGKRGDKNLSFCLGFINKINRGITYGKGIRRAEIVGDGFSKGPKCSVTGGGRDHASCFAADEPLFGPPYGC